MQKEEEKNQEENLHEDITTGQKLNTEKENENEKESESERVNTEDIEPEVET